MQPQPENFTIVIFGPTGDLAARKLFPAMFKLASHAHMPDQYRIIGAGRAELSHEEFRQLMRRKVMQMEPGAVGDEGEFLAFLERLFYVRLDLDDVSGYYRLSREIMDTAGQEGVCNHLLYYLAVPPSLAPVIAANLDKSGLGGKGCSSGRRKIIVEKPYGEDLQSARALNSAIGEVFEESQIFRIDHYLGKESVQNILVFRFSNGIFEPIWNRHYLADVRIFISEDFGVRERGAFYEKVGLLRDIVQNHALQILASIAMEPPVDFSADAIRDEKAKVLRCIRKVSPDDVEGAVILGQYEGYRQEKDVAPDSRVETFAALKVFVDNWRWKGVPFYIEAGKNLAERFTEITVSFRCPPQNFFMQGDRCACTPNQVVMRIQPEETISLRFGAKRPGEVLQTDPVSMRFDYRDAYPGEELTAYHKLLLDAMSGDQTNFIRQDSVEHSWAVVDAIRHAVDGRVPLLYPIHSNGPEEAQRIYG